MEERSTKRRKRGRRGKRRGEPLEPGAQPATTHGGDVSEGVRGTPGPCQTLGAALDDRAHQRSTLGLIQQAISKGWLNAWEVDPALFKGLPAMVAASLKRSIDCNDERSLLRAVEALRGMARDNLTLAEATDREARLDYGLPTSNVGTYKLTFDTND